MQKDFIWRQDISTVTIQITLKNTQLKKITVTIGDLFLKVTCPDKGYAKIFDLFNEVDFSSPKNTIAYSNNILTVVIQKQSKNIWQDLEVLDLSRSDNIDRRQQSIARFEKWTQEQEELEKTRRQELAKQMLNERIRLEDQKRQVISDRAEKIKEEAIDYVYQDQNSKEKQLEILEKDTTKLDEKIVHEKENSGSKFSAPENQIWDDEDFVDRAENPTSHGRHQEDDSETEEQSDDEEKSTTRRNAPSTSLLTQKPVRSIPPPRKDLQTHTLDFTEKLFPTLAARESQFMNAPLPRIKARLMGAKKKTGEKIDPKNFKNPLWMKDKGDEFFKNNDFLSAINAYNSALQLDPNYLEPLSNRGICNLKLFKLDEALKDCYWLLEAIAKAVKKESQSKGDLVVQKSDAEKDREKLEEGKGLISSQAVPLPLGELQEESSKRDMGGVKKESSGQLLFSSVVEFFELNLEFFSDTKSVMLNLEIKCRARSGAVLAYLGYLELSKRVLSEVKKRGDYLKNVTVNLMEAESKEAQKETDELVEDGSEFQKQKKVSKYQKQLDVILSVQGKLEEDLVHIDDRLSIGEIKRKADAKFKSNKISEATELYQTLILEGKDSNEYANNNIAACYLKLEMNEDVVKHSSKSIDQLSGLLKFYKVPPKKHQSKKLNETESSKFMRQDEKQKYIEMKQNHDHLDYMNQHPNIILAKCHYRRALAHFELCQLQQAKEDAKQVIRLQETNVQARQLLKKIEDQETFRISESLKKSANELLSMHKPGEAVEKYTEALKHLNPVEFVVEYIAISLNKCVGLMQLENWGDLIQTCVSALKALRRVKDSPIKIKSKDLTQEERHKLENFEVNILIRRGNAYLKLGQLFHAKSDFESVIKLQPNNEAVRETLAKINSEQ